MSEEMQRSYYAILPANVRYDSKLTPNAKLLYAEITALCNEKGYCWASNDYFAQLYGVSKKSVSAWINQLISEGYLTSELIYKDGSQHIQERRLRIATAPMEENRDMEENFKGGWKKTSRGYGRNLLGGMEENFQENSIYINTTTNNKKNTKDKKIKNDKHAEREKSLSSDSHGNGNGTATAQGNKSELSEGKPKKVVYRGNPNTAETMQKLYNIQAKTEGRLLHPLTKELITRGYISELDENIQKYNDLFFKALNTYEYPLVIRCFNYTLKWALKAKDKINSKYTYFAKSLEGNLELIDKRENKPEAYLESLWGISLDDGESREGPMRTETAKGGEEGKGIYNWLEN